MDNPPATSAVVYVCGESAKELIEKARRALQAGERDEALTLAEKAAAQAPKDVNIHLLTGSVQEALGHFKKAAASYTKVIDLDPKQTEAHHLRGSAHFKAGAIAASVRDYDKYVELNPQRKVSHWQRGISYYYAGQYEDGRLQFEGYQTFDSNDVENAVWRYMCMAKKDGIPAARKAMLKIGEDKRVPMRQVYEMFSGRLKPEEVMAAAVEGELTKEQKSRHLFYAHLYVGIHFDLEGDRKKALDHLNKATDDHRIGHYMWDVARVHRDILRKVSPKE